MPPERIETINLAYVALQSHRDKLTEIVKKRDEAVTLLREILAERAPVTAIRYEMHEQSLMNYDAETQALKIAMERLQNSCPFLLKEETNAT